MIAPDSTPPAPARRSYELPAGAAVSVLLPLAGPAGAVPPYPDQLRKGILRVLRERGTDRSVGTAIASRLHDDPGESGHPWAVSPSFWHAGQAYFRLTAVGIATARQLGELLGCGSPMVPDHWSIGPLPGWRTTAASAHELAGDPADVGPSRLGVALLSHTALSGARRGTYAIPSAAGLVEGWRRRWLAHLGAEHPLAGLIALPARGLPDPFAIWLRDEVTIASGGLRLERCALAHDRRQRIPVAAGILVLRLPAGWTLAHAALRALWRFSMFCGSGRHLTNGFGQTLPFVASTLTPRSIAASTRDLPGPALAGGPARSLLIKLHRHKLPLRAGR